MTTEHTDYEARLTAVLAHIHHHFDNQPTPEFFVEADDVWRNCPRINGYRDDMYPLAAWLDRYDSYQSKTVR